MTLDEALGLRQGQHVIHRATAPPLRPCRITELWINSKRTLVRVRLASVDPSAWLDACSYELPPAKQLWDERFLDWVSREEFRKRRAVGITHPHRVITVPYEDEP